MSFTAGLAVSHSSRIRNIITRIQGMGGGVVTIDTGAFVAVMGIRGELLADYDKINNEFDRIRDTLLANWEGKGKDEFQKDATNIKRNIGGICDVLKTMSDTLTDCLEIITLSDAQAGAANREPPPQG